MIPITKAAIKLYRYKCVEKPAYASPPVQFGEKSRKTTVTIPAGANELSIRLLLLHC